MNVTNGEKTRLDEEHMASIQASYQGWSFPEWDDNDGIHSSTCSGSRVREDSIEEEDQ